MSFGLTKSHNSFTMNTTETIEKLKKLEEEFSSFRKESVYYGLYEVISSALTLLQNTEKDTELRENLLECYEEIACQSRCGCLHPACRNCGRDKELDEAKAAIAAQQEESK